MAEGSSSSSSSNSNADAWAAGLGAFGSILKGYGAYVEGQVRAETLEYNAFVAEQDAKQVEKAKKHELHKSITAQRKLLARQVAATAASGRSMSGSPLDVMNRTESEALLDQSIIRSNAASAKGRLYGEAIMNRGAADIARRMGRAKSISELFVTGSSNFTQSNYFKNMNKKKET